MEFNNPLHFTQTQTQKQSYVPNLVQGVQLLQFNRLELSSYLNQTILDNPFIKIPEEENQLINNSLSETTNIIEQTASYQQSIYDFLMEQAFLFYRKGELRNLVFWWINNLDDKGFVTASMEEAQQITQALQTQLLDSLTLLHQLDPPGIGARNIQECLMLQTERLEFSPPIAYLILEEHFDDLFHKRWSLIAEDYRISLEQVEEVYQFVQRLSLSPIEMYNARSETVPFIIPELVVSLSDGNLTIEETRYKTPLLSFDLNYFNEMKTIEDSEVSSFLKEKRQEFEQLQTSLKRRGETILQVGTAIVLHQQNFFSQKERSLVPLQLTDLAQICKLDVSTISRAVRETYIQTPQGVFELKSFLSRRTPNGDQSKDTITRLIQEWIRTEDKQRPLSDQKLVELLSEKEIKLSRRAITKYRKQLNIASSVKRKIK
ncbi:RNA polymerase factor sigma-54 [Lacticigenium naphthae]|uniref:RNA polymerase factor sigma-54 n=1 Tax=Lacticigenium naphthae TaxID=515351 RepID=UPI000416FDE0|nr:RNA polymerase factor sigma-54 [Lacticigenium naphthae]